VTEPARLAPALGEFMGGLHLAPLEKMEKLVERDSYPLSAWLEDAERDYGQIAEHIPAALRRLIEEFLGHAWPAERSVEAFCHNDLGAEHVLVNAEANDVTGIIDWTDVAIADPARDLALVFRDLGPGAFELTLAHYGGSLEDVDRELAVFYARCKFLPRGHRLRRGQLRRAITRRPAWRASSGPSRILLRAGRHRCAQDPNTLAG
jgi:aminoglycoside phosphotransferase (APT) family kinase protein